MAAKVENRIAFAFPFFKMEILAIVIPTFSVSSVTLIFLFASMTSRWMIIAIVFIQTVRSFSAFMSIAFRRSFSKTAAKTQVTSGAKIKTRPIITAPGASSLSAT